MPVRFASPDLRLLAPGVEQHGGGKGIERHRDAVLQALGMCGLQILEQHRQRGILGPPRYGVPVSGDPTITRADLEQVQELVLGKVVVRTELQTLGDAIHDDAQHQVVDQLGSLAVARPRTVVKGV